MLGWLQVPHPEQHPDLTIPFIETFALFLLYFFSREIKHNIQRSQCVVWKHLPTLTKEKNRIF